MKINYEYTKDDYKKFLLKGRIINNIVLFVIVLILFTTSYFELERLSTITTS